MRQISYPPPRVKIHDNGNVEITYPWRIKYGDLCIIVIPEGFISDGNSVPWIFTRLVPKFGRNTLAGIVHDYLYKTAKMMIADIESPLFGSVSTPYHDKTVTRQLADAIRLDLCVKCSVPWYQRILSYWALRVFGRGAWNTHRKREHDKFTMDAIRQIKNEK
jgi:hypothetical protein